MKNYKDENLDILFKAVMSLESLEECYAFFDDLCTVTELKSLAQRFEVARLLDEKCVYTDIAEKTGASSATISRVNRALLYGSSGYKGVIDKMKGKENE